MDFAAVSHRLVIEIDGPLHLLEAQKQIDAERDERLHHAGWRVLRISADQAEDSEGLFARFVEEFGL